MCCPPPPRALPWVALRRVGGVCSFVLQSLVSEPRPGATDGSQQFRWRYNVPVLRAWAERMMAFPSPPPQPLGGFATVISRGLSRTLFCKRCVSGVAPCRAIFFCSLALHALGAVPPVPTCRAVDGPAGHVVLEPHDALPCPPPLAHHHFPFDPCRCSLREACRTTARTSTLRTPGCTSGMWIGWRCPMRATTCMQRSRRSF
jgi:hypothetical protein